MEMVPKLATSLVILIVALQIAHAVAFQSAAVSRALALEKTCTNSSPNFTCVNNVWSVYGAFRGVALEIKSRAVVAIDKVVVETIEFQREGLDISLSIGGCLSAMNNIEVSMSLSKAEADALGDVGMVGSVVYVGGPSRCSPNAIIIARSLRCERLVAAVSIVGANLNVEFGISESCSKGESRMLMAVGIGLGVCLVILSTFLTYALCVNYGPPCKSSKCCIRLRGGSNPDLRYNETKNEEVEMQRGNSPQQ